MSMKYLGETFDIHGGGLENSFPHHEDEIAQAEAATGKPFAKYWLHNNMVTVGGQKMGKSLGNFITLKDAYKKWNPMVLRLFILQSHYRSPLDFSDEALGAAKDGYNGLLNSMELLLERLQGCGEGRVSDTLRSAIEQAKSRFFQALDDDFNTPQAVAEIHDIAQIGNRLVLDANCTSADIIVVIANAQWLARTILGLNLPLKDVLETIENKKAQALVQEIGKLQDEMNTRLEEIQKGSLAMQTGSLYEMAKYESSRSTKPGKFPEVVSILTDLRNDARKSKNFAQADAIRKRLEEIGILLEDSPQGTKWRFK
jgi:cysteinyl-tRNA synthetase